MLFKQLRLISGPRFGSRFLEKGSRGARIFVWCKQGTKCLKNAHKKNCAPEFLIFSALKLPPWRQVFFIDINTDIRDCSRIALDKYYIFTKKY